jgi:hypothetical protein
MVRWCVLGSVVISVAVGLGCSSKAAAPASGSTSDAGSGDPSVGEAVVNSYGCKTCHGDDMAGQTTPIAVAGNKIPCLALYPPNLTPDPDTGIAKWTDGQLQTAIVDGVDNKSMSLCAQMKHYKDAGADEVTNMIAFLRALPAVKKTIPTSVCPPLKGACDGGI